MFSSWFTTESKKSAADVQSSEDKAETDASETVEHANESKDKPSEKSFESQLDGAKDAALTTAKEWGGYLMKFGRSATKTVTDTASKMKNSIEDHTILGEFNREQRKFAEEREEGRRHTEAAVPPWVGYSEETVMKQQILALSQDKRNFMRNPPAGVQFKFDYASHHKIALATLQEDSFLQKMRFELVPKQISEESFWRNYFYRVSLIKQSTQLSSLTSESASQGGDSNSGDSEKESSKPTTPQPARVPRVDSAEEGVAGSPPLEFVSDAFSGDIPTEEELKKEMEQLRVTDDAGWSEGDADLLEDELQQELEDYDVVPGEDEDLEAEILRQLEAEAERT